MSFIVAAVPALSACGGGEPATSRDEVLVAVLGDSITPGLADDERANLDYSRA